MPNDIIASSQTELTAALKTAKGGETISLAPGVYTSLKLGGVAFSSPVTITSQDPAQRATIMKVDLNKSSNVAFRNVDLGRQISPPEPDYTQLVNVTACQHVLFEGVAVFGGVGDPSLSLGWGMFLRGSQDMTVRGCSFDHLCLALILDNVDGATVEGNTFLDNRRDAMNLKQVTKILIDGNTFSDMHPVGGEHPDAIQFMTAGSTAISHDIEIRNNVVMQGDGEPIQGIFMGEEVGTLPYTNVKIINNLIYVNGMFNGISVKNGRNVTIEGNSVLSRTDDAVRAWIRLEGVAGARVAGNVSDEFIAKVGNTDLVVEGNKWLVTESATLRQFGNLNALAAATIEDLIVEGVGYQPPKPAKASDRDLLLGLQFTPAGLADASRFKSVVTTKPIDLSRISGGMYAVKTGAGFDLNRSNSVQIYALPAMTVSFDMKRDSATAPAGQILGIYQSWSVSVTPSGELSAVVRNDAGKSVTITTSGAKLVDTAVHRIGLSFDGAAGEATLSVDGVVKGKATVSGSTRPIESWGLYIGSPFATAFSGAIGNIEIREAA